MLELLKSHRPAHLVLLADADVTLNANFAFEMAKLGRLLSEGPLRFVQTLKIAKMALDGPKGVDDVRAARRVDFNDHLEAVILDGYDLPRKASATEVFVTLLGRETESAKQLLSRRDHAGIEARRRLLQSAALLWHETGAALELKPVLAEVLGVSKTQAEKLVTDALKNASSKKPDGELSQGKSKDKAQSPARIPVNLDPWPGAVAGAELLDSLTTEFERFLWLPPHGAGLLAILTLYSYLWESFEWAPILAVTSPTPACGKGRVLDVLEKVVCRPWRTGNATVPVLFRIIEQNTPFCLIDEFDSVDKDSRATIANILNQGFHVSGRVHRVEGDKIKAAVEYRCFCPKVVACIRASTIGRATATRCINLRMQKKPRKTKLERFRKYDGTECRSKCARWAMDNKSQVEALYRQGVRLPDELEDREQDIWEPLFTVAEAAGGDWPQHIRAAALHFCGQRMGGEVEDSGVAVLRAFRDYFTEQGTDRVSSEAICEWLNKQPDAGFDGWRDGKGMDQRALAKVLRPFDIQPQSVAIGRERPKGYLFCWFSELWEAHLPPDPAPNERNSATNPVNIGGNGNFTSATERSGSGSKNGVSTSEDGQSGGVADKSEPEAILL